MYKQYLVNSYHHKFSYVNEYLLAYHYFLFMVRKSMVFLQNYQSSNDGHMIDRGSIFLDIDLVLRNNNMALK